MPDASAFTTLSFAFSVTAPIFVMVLVGVALKRVGMINDDFINTASKIVFNLGLPTLLFISSAATDFSSVSDLRLLLALCAATLIVFFLTQLTARWQVKDARDQGVFVQGAFRGNLVITGLAFCANAYGDHGLVIAALPVAMTVIIYNLLSVYTLTRSLQQADKNTFARTWQGIVRNPLIIAIAAGFLVNAAHVPLPEVLLDSAGYLGQMVLPLALICIGGALNMKQLRHVDRTALLATSWKLVASPIIACSLGLTLGLAEENLVILFLLAASPTATVSFVMVQAMGGHAKLAANIILHTTLISLVTITAGLWLLRATGWA